MTTTVQVRDETRRLLERLKKQMGAQSYDDVIRRLARSKAGIPDSLFGACKGSRRFVRERENEHHM
jgi:predicted CopG family antitoxin